MTYSNAFDSLALLRSNIPLGYDVGIFDFPSWYLSRRVDENSPTALCIPVDKLNELLHPGDDPIHATSNKVNPDEPIDIGGLVSLDMIAEWDIPLFSDISVGIYGWIPPEYLLAFPNHTWVDSVSELSAFDFGLIGACILRNVSDRIPSTVPILSFYPPAHTDDYHDYHPPKNESEHMNIWFSRFDLVPQVIYSPNMIRLNGIVPLRGVIELQFLNYLGVV